MAAQNGHLAVVNALIGARANINATTAFDFTPFDIATQEGHIEIANMLRDNNNQPSDSGVHSNRFR